MLSFMKCVLGEINHKLPKHFDKLNQRLMICSLNTRHSSPARMTTHSTRPTVCASAGARCAWLTKLVAHVNSTCRSSQYWDKCTKYPSWLWNFKVTSQVALYREIASPTSITALASRVILMTQLVSMMLAPDADYFIGRVSTLSPYDEKWFVFHLAFHSAIANMPSDLREKLLLVNGLTEGKNHCWIIHLNMCKYYIYQLVSTRILMSMIHWNHVANVKWIWWELHRKHDEIKKLTMFLRPHFSKYK